MKISLTAMLLLCLFTTISFAQEETQSKRSEFGISVGANAATSSVKPVESLEFLEDGIKTNAKPGFSLGIMYRFRLNDLLVLRTEAELSFSEFEFESKSEYVTLNHSREMVNIDFPLHLVFEKSNKNVTPSAFIGGRYRYDAGAKEYDYTGDNGEPLGKFTAFRRDDILLDVGIGVALKMECFTFKPEFVYSRGLLNQVGEREMLYDSAYNNQFSLRFLFYGS